VLLPALSVAALLLMLAATLQESFHMAFGDELTGLPGRRAFNETLKRATGTYSIAMIDVDHFKKFNDTHGHDVGDQVLRLVAGQLRRIGGGGKAYRYGGEEFTLVFPGRSLDECRPHLEAVRRAIETYQLHLRDKSNRPQSDRAGRQQRRSSASGTVSVTISIGVAEREPHQRSAEEVIRSADKALYSAKRAGRNCVVSNGQNRRGAVRVATVD